MIRLRRIGAKTGHRGGSYPRNGIGPRVGVQV